jgi:phage FluMu protein Com
MDVTSRCPQCGAKLSVDDFAGQLKLWCPDCGYADSGGPAGVGQREHPTSTSACSLQSGASRGRS